MISQSQSFNRAFLLFFFFFLHMFIFVWRRTASVVERGSPPVLLSPNDWHYVAEGAASIVVAYESFALRLAKSPIVAAESANAEDDDVVDAVEVDGDAELATVWRTQMAERISTFGWISVGKPIDLSREFVIELVSFFFVSFFCLFSF